MFTSRCLSLATVVTALALLAGYANSDPYDTQNQSQGGAGKTAKYDGLGTLAGVIAGAAIDHNNHGKDALIDAAAAGMATTGYGYYASKQEAELRRQTEGTGVGVQRQGDDVKLIMLDNITFTADSANITPNFYVPLNSLVNSFKQYNQNTIEIVNYTNSTSSRRHDMDLSQRYARSVVGYLTAQGADGTCLSTHGVGPDQPTAGNSTADGHVQSRCVEVNL